MRDLSLHILDLVQNSIEAGANEVKIEVIESRLQDQLIIRVADNGRGMTAEQCAKVRDPFHTSRTTRPVGLGLPLIDMSTSQCGGCLTIDSTVGSGTAVEALYRPSHIDCPPLGDFVNTLKVLVVGNPAINIVVMYRVDERQFSFSSREIQEIIGDIPFTHPEILRWLHDYIQSNIELISKR